MIPVKQTTRGGADSPPEERGDCFSACLASILELDIEEVPRFCELESDDWGPSISAWLKGLGLTWVELGWSDYTRDVIQPCLGWHTVSGMSPRGNRHAVVARGSNLVFDPHPDITGAPELEPDDVDNADRMWTLGILVPLDPGDWA